MEEKIILSQLLNNINQAMIRFDEPSEQANLEQAKGLRLIEEKFLQGELELQDKYFIGSFNSADAKQEQLYEPKFDMEEYVAQKIGLDLEHASTIHLEKCRDLRLVKVFLTPDAIKTYIAKNSHCLGN